MQICMFILYQMLSCICCPWLCVFVCVIKWKKIKKLNTNLKLCIAFLVYLIHVICWICIQLKWMSSFILLHHKEVLHPIYCNDRVVVDMIVLWRCYSCFVLITMMFTKPWNLWIVGYQVLIGNFDTPHVKIFNLLDINFYCVFITTKIDRFIEISYWILDWIL